MQKTITSFQNPLIKNILKLQQKSSERTRQGLFVAEGRREVSLALASGARAENLVFCQELYEPEPDYPIDEKNLDKKSITYVGKEVYNKIAYRENAEGVMVVAEKTPPSLDDYTPDKNPLILVLEGLEKPGNIGAILRTADAAAVDAVLLCNPVTDIFNPNTIRTSLGCVFTMPVISCTTAQAISWLKKNQVEIYAAAVQANVLYFQEDFRGYTALVFGSEDKGLSAQWTESANHLIKIPMGGRIDSLNVSASVSIIAFEAVKQRGIKPRKR